MATKNTSPAKKKEAVATETSNSIASQTQAFLESGGVIEQVAAGVSGQSFTVGRKHISLGNTPKKD